MNKGLNIIAILIVLAIAGTTAIGAYQCGRHSSSYKLSWGADQTPLYYDYPTSKDRQSFTPRLPYWQVEAYWKQTWSAWPGEDHIGPTTHTFYWAVQPDSTAVDSLFKPQLPGRWRLAKIVRTTLLKPGRRIEEPQPDKDAPAGVPELK